MEKITFAVLIAVLGAQVVARFKDEIGQLATWLPKVVTFFVSAAIAYCLGADWVLPLLYEVGFEPTFAASTLVISSLIIGAGPDALAAAIERYTQREAERISSQT